MRRAVELGEGVRRRTAPNPWVGCVLVRDGEIVGEGSTEPPGVQPEAYRVTVVSFPEMAGRRSVAGRTSGDRAQLFSLAQASTVATAPG